MEDLTVLFFSEQTPFNRVTGVKVNIYNKLLCLSQVSKLVCVYPYRCEEEIQPVAGEPLAFDASFRFIKVGESGSRILNRIGVYYQQTVGRLLTQRRLKQKLEEIIAETAPDVVWLEYGFIANLILLFKSRKLPVIFVTHNAEARLYFQKWKQEKRIAYRLLLLPYVACCYLQEKVYLRFADRLLAISEHDGDYYRRQVGAKNIDVLPIILDESEFDSKPALKAEHDYICMVGSMDSFQNYNGMIYFVTEIWPMVRERHPELRLYLVGRLPKEGSDRHAALAALTRRDANIVVTGVVDDTVPYVKGARLSVVPILEGGGTRTKIVESAACRTPVVSTTKGAEGLSLKDGESIMIGDTAEAFAAGIDLLLADRECRERIVEGAHAVYRREQGREAGKVIMRQILQKALCK